MEPACQAWEPMHEHASVAEPLESGRWRITYIRDFLYRSDAPPTYRWSLRDIDIANVTAAHFYVLPLGQLRKIGGLFAHTCLGFSFNDGTDVIYSIEARQRAGEEYRPNTDSQNIRIFSTLAYFSGFRHVVRKRGFSRYPITVPQGGLVSLLNACLKDAQGAYGRFDHYHPVTNQCTTALITAMNRGLEEPIPRHPYWYLTRLTHRLLAAHGILDLNKKENL